MCHLVKLNEVKGSCCLMYQNKSEMKNLVNNVMLFFHILVKEYLPSILILTPTGQEQNGGITFIATWNSSSMLESTEMTLSISPAPLHGESVRTISNASFLLSLNSNTLYALNISMCNLTYSVQFMLGNNLINFN